MNISLLINDKKIESDINPSITLLEFLRSEGYFGTKFGGCKKGECGACTVILNDKAVNACLVLAAEADNSAP